eukprot:ctg_611.g335
MSGEQQQQQPPQPVSPVPCATGCGFYGRPETLNMCSKCFRDYDRASKAPNEGVGGSGNGGATTSQEVGSTDAAAPTAKEPMPKMEAAVAANSAAAPEPTATSSAAGPPAEETAASSTPTDAATKPVRPVQADHALCWKCEKRVGLLGFKCRCGYTFCAAHRHAEQHACDFDYRAKAQKELAEANPLVVASKVEKI